MIGLPGCAWEVNSFFLSSAMQRAIHSGTDAYHIDSTYVYICFALVGA